MKIEIKSRFNGEVLFSHEAEENSIKITLKVALQANANLRYADLRNADLRNADLMYADLSSADLMYANLSGAILSGAKIGEEVLQDIKQIGPIGSRKDYTIFFKFEKHIEVQCGCFKGNLTLFTEQVCKVHGDTQYGKEYAALIAFIKNLWEN